MQWTALPIDITLQPGTNNFSNNAFLFQSCFMSFSKDFSLTLRRIRSQDCRLRKQTWTKIILSIIFFNLEEFTVLSAKLFLLGSWNFFYFKIWFLKCEFVFFISSLHPSTRLYYVGLGDSLLFKEGRRHYVKTGRIFVGKEYSLNKWTLIFIAKLSCILDFQQ